MCESVRQLLRPRALQPGDLVVIASLSAPLLPEYEANVEHTERLFERMGFRVRREPLLQAGHSRWWSAAVPAQIAASWTPPCENPRSAPLSRTMAVNRLSGTWIWWISTRSCPSEADPGVQRHLVAAPGSLLADGSRRLVMVVVSVPRFVSVMLGAGGTALGRPSGVGQNNQ